MTQLISIIVPVYNVEKFLPKCIDSVMKQSYRDFELLLIDDGSTDNSAAICDEYAGRYECCRVFHRKNAGVTASRNIGLSEAKGKYIVFLDSDDYIEKETLAKIYEQMEVQQYDICSFAARRIDEAGRFLYELRFDDMVTSLCFQDESRDKFLLKDFLQYRTGWEVCFHAFRRDIIEREQIRFEEKLSYAEDLLFTFEYMLYVDRWIKIPDILYNYTLRAGSATKELERKVMIEGIMYYAFERIRKRLCQKDSNCYNAQSISLFYAALLYYFFPSFTCFIGIEGVRDILKAPEIWSVQERELKILVSKKKELQELFGEKAGTEMYHRIIYLLDGNGKKYAKSCKRLWNK